MGEKTILYTSFQKPPGPSGPSDPHLRYLRWDPGAAKKSEAWKLGAGAKSSARPADAAPTLQDAAAAATGDGDGRVIHSWGVGNHGCLKTYHFSSFFGNG